MLFEKFFYGVCYYPEAWDPGRHESDIDRIAEAGFNFVRMGESAWSFWEPEEGRFQFDLFDRVIDRCRERNVRVILGTPTYACPAWAATKYPEILRWNYQRLPMAHGSRRNLNYTSPAMLALSDRICTALADHYRDEPLIMGWQLDNEFNCHMDVSYAPSDTIAFRQWCRAKYETLEILNRRWGTAFWSQTYSDWEQIDLPHPTATYLNPSLLMDEARFISDKVVEFAGRQADILRARNAKWFITHNGLFGNVDGRKLIRKLDFFSHDHYPLFFPNWQTHAELLIRSRSLTFPFGILEQQAGPGGQMEYLHRTPRRGELRLWALESVAHGANLFSYFRWRTCPYGSEQHWHGLLDADDRDNRRLAEAVTVGEELRRLPMDFFSAAPVRTVAVERDYENEINDWRINTYPGAGRTEYRSWIAEMLSRHVPVDEVWPDSDWSGYSLVIVPHHKMTDAAYVEKLTAFVTAGGSIIFGAQSGSKTNDVHIVSMPLPGLLASLAGIEVEDWTVLPGDQTRAAVIESGDERVEFISFVERLKMTTAEPVAHWQTDDTLLAGGIAISVNRVGRGKVYYLGGYCSPATVGTLAEFFMRQLDLNSVVQASANVECIRRESGENRYTCLLNHSTNPEKVRDCPTGVDLLSGQPVTTDLTLEPLDVMIIKSKT